MLMLFQAKKTCFNTLIVKILKQMFNRGYSTEDALYVCQSP